jgi:hypothetical protein
MMSGDQPLASIRFEAEIIQWRGPAPYLFVPVPDEHVGEIRYAARSASYGWGVIPVEARIGAVSFATSLFPKNGTYLLPIKVKVQEAAGVGVGDSVDVQMRINSR